MLETLRAMGRWAQAKRRSSPAAAGPGLPAPPAPGLEQDGGELVASRNGLPNPFGAYRLYDSAVSGGPYAYTGLERTGEPAVFDEELLTEGRYYVATAIGAPPNYGGESSYSIEVHYTLA